MKNGVGGRGSGLDFLENGLAYEISVVSRDAGVVVFAVFAFIPTPRYAFFDLVFNAFW